LRGLDAFFIAAAALWPMAGSASARELYVGEGDLGGGQVGEYNAGTTASAGPGVITYLAGSIPITEASVTGTNGPLDVNYWNGSAWNWSDQGAIP
jgi:hypothetical protein